VPVYEYRCNNCRRRVSLLVRSLSQPPEAVCRNCGSKDLTRLFSTFARLRTDQDIYADILDDSQLVERMMANDPTALVEWSRRMEGTEVEKHSEYGEALEKMEKGERWDKAMADLQRREPASTEAPAAEE